MAAAGTATNAETAIGSISGVAVTTSVKRRSRMRTSLVVLTIGLAVGLAGCESKIGRGAASGGAGGAAVGAVVPGPSTEEVAGICAAGGAVVGALHNDEQGRQWCSGRKSAVVGKRV